MVPRNFGSLFHPSSLRFQVKRTISVFSGLTFNTISLHHLLARLSAPRAKLDAVLASLAYSSTVRSSAYPCAYIPALLIWSNSLSTTYLVVGCRQTTSVARLLPLEGIPVRLRGLRGPLAPWDRELAGGEHVSDLPDDGKSMRLRCPADRLHRDAVEGPPMSRKTPTAMHPFFLAFSSLFTSL